MNSLNRRAFTFTAGAAALNACAPSPTANTLKVWHAYRGREATAFQAVLDQYNAALPKSAAPVRGVSVPYDAMADKISAAVPRGKGPDIFIFAHERLGGWVEAGRTVEPIGFWINDSLRTQLLPGLLNALNYRDETFGVPLNFKSIAMISNAASTPAPPSTTGELARQAATRTDAARGQFGLVYPYDDFFYHAALQNGFGGGVFDDKGAPILDHPGNVAAAELLLKWRRQSPTMPDDPSFALVQSLFNQGRAATVFSGPWFLGEVSKQIAVTVSPLPRLDEANGAPIRPWLTIEAGFIAARGRRMEEAFAFLTYLAGPQAGLIMARDGGQLHASQAVYEMPEVKADPVALAFKAQLETAIPMPNIPEMTLIWSPADKAMKRIVKGEASPTAAWRDAQTEVVDAIAALRGSAR
jgi:arabinogalactan oligomer/maltooligosaccharide transport system substrate-binding protein